MKRAGVAVGFLVALGVAFAFNSVQTGDYSPSNFFQWLLSLWRRTETGLMSETDAVTGGGDARTIAQGLIMGFEGFRAKTYTDVTGNPTIGYGHKLVAGDGFDSNSVISESDAAALLLSDMESIVACVENAVTAPMTPGQEAAMVSLAYNIGCGNFQSSTLLKAFNDGDTTTASSEFLKWDKGHIGGVLTVIADLTSRRSSEQSVFDGATVQAPTQVANDYSLTDPALSFTDTGTVGG